MAAIIHPLLTLLASLTRQELARQVTYLKAENQILRSRLSGRLPLNNQEKRKLLRHGKPLGARIKELISIVSYSTFRKWVREMEDGAGQAKPDQSAKKTGRPKTAEGIPKLIVRIGTRRIWGSPCTAHQTAHQTADWTSQQARNFVIHVDEHGLACRTVMRDNDKKYPKTFDDVFTTSTCRVKRNEPASPNLQAHVERVVQTLKHEVLNGFCLVNEQHLDLIFGSVRTGTIGGGAIPAGATCRR